MPADEPDDISDLSARPRHDSLLKKVALSIEPPSSPPPLALAPGRKLGDRYVIVRAIGSGGMGEVYLARDVTLEREVAIKRHRHGREVERLRREAIAMARLAHPNVVTVFEVGEIDGGAYVAMEYVPGATLRGYLAEKARPRREVLAMLRQVGEGLAAAHAAGIVHRDFKPENVLIGEDGRPRVSDFGLARDARAAAAVAEAGGDEARTVSMAPGERASALPLGGDAATAATLPVAEQSRRATAETLPALGRGSTAPPRLHQIITQAGAVMGTPAYMAPEQAAGEAVDARADQFAFCVVAWEALFGARPVAGGRPRGSTGRSVDGGALQLRRGRSLRRIRAALARGLAVAPADRYPSMRALLDDLADRLPWRAALLAAVGVAAAGALTWQLTREAPLRCDDAGAEIASLQTPMLAGEASALVGKQLADLRRDFRAAAASSCRARQSGAWAPELYLRARACLAVQREVAKGQLALLTSPGAPRALELALPLPPAAACADAEQLTRWPAPPERGLAAAASARAALELAERALARRDRPVAAALLRAAASSPHASAAFLASRIAGMRAATLLAEGELARGQRELAQVRIAAAASGDAEAQLRAIEGQLRAAFSLRLDRKAAEALLPAATAEADALSRRAPESAARVFLTAAEIVIEEPRPMAPFEGPEAPPPAARPAGDDDATIFTGLTQAQASTRGADRAAALLTKALALLGEGRRTPLHIPALQQRALSHLIMGRFAEARADHASALALARQLYGEASAEVARVAARCALDLSDLDGASEEETCAAEAEQILAASDLPRSAAMAAAQRLLGEQLHLQGKLAAARAHLQAARQTLQTLEAKDLELAAVDQALALVHFDERHPEQAMRLLDEALAIQSAALAEGHLELASTQYNLAVARRDRGDLARARQHARRAADAFIANGDGDHARFALSLLAEIANRSGDWHAALDATADVRKWTRASDATSLAWPRLERGRALLALNDPSHEAYGLLSEARGIYDVLRNEARVREIDELLASRGKSPPR